MCVCVDEVIPQKERLQCVRRVLREYGKMYNAPFFLEYNDKHPYPYRVEINNNGHYFPTERDAVVYAENRIMEYFQQYPRRKLLR